MTVSLKMKTQMPKIIINAISLARCRCTDKGDMLKFVARDQDPILRSSGLLVGPTEAVIRKP
jgi:hypothetical protein